MQLVAWFQGTVILHVLNAVIHAKLPLRCVGTTMGTDSLTCLLVVDAVALSASFLSPKFFTHSLLSLPLVLLFIPFTLYSLVHSSLHSTVSNQHPSIMNLLARTALRQATRVAAPLSTRSLSLLVRSPAITTYLSRAALCKVLTYKANGKNYQPCRTKEQAQQAKTYNKVTVSFFFK